MIKPFFFKRVNEAYEESKPKAFVCVSIVKPKLDKKVYSYCTYIHRSATIHRSTRLRKNTSIVPILATFGSKQQDLAGEDLMNGNLQTNHMKIRGAICRSFP